MIIVFVFLYLRDTLLIVKNGETSRCLFDVGIWGKKTYVCQERRNHLIPDMCLTLVSRQNASLSREKESRYVFLLETHCIFPSVRLLIYSAHMMSSKSVQWLSKSASSVSILMFEGLH